MLESFVSEAFEYKKLTEAEQKSRGILGRLVGVIADTQKPTRNGRKYSEKLWENVFENPIMKEKIANRCCFGELNHPADRSEVDLERVAICLAEYPKKDSNGQLHGVFDILSTPNGRILKALCDYGCKIGISSRGQGDLITDDNGDEAVDPDTYDCECFDAVIVPGVEVARLKYVTESLHKDKTLSTVLTEELAIANSDDRKIMEETLDMLKIKLTEAENEEDTAVVDQPEVDADVADATEVEIDASIEFDDEIDPEDEITAEEEAEDISDENVEDSEPEDQDDRSDEQIFLDFLASNFDEKQIKKVCDILDIDIKDDDDKSADDESEESDNDEDKTITDDEADEAKSDDIINDTEETQEEAEEEIEEAIDTGSEFLVQSLKEALTKTSDLESNVKSLQEELAVRDAKVIDLTEECNRYKSSIARLSTIAKSSKELKESVSVLEKTISEKNELIESQKARISRLAEARKADVEKSNEVTTLTESLKTVKADCETQVTTLNEELSRVKAQANADQVALNEKLAKATSLKEGYKKLANSVVNKYIEVKADILGLTSKDIKRKLGESYTIDDIDQVCEDLKSYSLNVSKLPFSVDRKVSVRVNESANKAPINRKPSVYDEDDVDSTLLKLAGFEN